MRQTIEATSLRPNHSWADDAHCRDWAASGVIPLTGPLNGPPLLPPGDAATRARLLSEYIAQATDGRVQLDGRRLLSERAAILGLRRAGTRSANGATRLLHTADGWAAVSCARPDDVALLGALIGVELTADPWPATAAWLARHPGQELADRADLLGVAASPISTQPPSPSGGSIWPCGPPRSVTGLRVVDFSALWAGPLCAHLLGLGGADVIKVETPGRPDGARRSREFYRLLHGGHRSVVVNPDVPQERRALAELVATADIVIESSRPRALQRFGLDAAEVTARGTTWISITADGRASNRIGFGDDIAAGAGLVAWRHNTPHFCGDAIADPLTGLVAAAAAYTEPPPGTGVLWDLSMSEIVSATLPADPTISAPTARLGAHHIAAPTARTADGQTHSSGADTAVVLGELSRPTR